MSENTNFITGRLQDRNYQVFNGPCKINSGLHINRRKQRPQDARATYSLDALRHIEHYAFM